jgi:uncharacterized protein (DUF2147 family)
MDLGTVFRFARPVIVAATLWLGLAAAAAQSSPVGLWICVDDHTGQELGVIRIFDRDGTLSGAIESTPDPADARRVCDKCRDDRHGRALLGLDFLRGLRPDASGGWSGGEILDPDTGQVYRASARLVDSGRKLEVRGYVLMSLLGRSQVWIRK